MVTVSLYHDTRRVLSDNTYPVKLRIGVGRKGYPIRTNISLSESDFSKVINSKNLTEDLKRSAKRLKKIKDRAEEIIDILQPFDIDVFKKMLTQTGDRTDLLFLLRDKSDFFEQEEKITSMNLYRQTANLLERYHREVNKGKTSEILPLSVVNVSWLKAFEKWALSLSIDRNKKGEIVNERVYSATTLSMYLIRVRSIFNEAISDRHISSELYPFHRPENKNGYKIPKAASNKRPLTKLEISSIYRYPAKTKIQEYHRDLFMFSYLASGMNMADVLTLEWKNVSQDHFTFVRRKTAAKLNSSVIITIPLSKQLKAIIDKHATDKNKSKRVFKEIPDGATEREIKQTISVFISSMNANLKKIASNLGITDKISTYFARHAYSSNLMQSEAPIAFISKQLGHQDIKTTQAYLDTFTNEQAAKYQENLLDEE